MILNPEILMRSFVLSLFVSGALPLAALAQSAPEVVEGQWYRLNNQGFYRLGQTMCTDVFNGGPDDNQLDSRPCDNYSGQYWQFRSAPTAYRGLPTYAMSTMFRGDQMCLTLEGSLIDHVLRLAPCAGGPSANQIFAVQASKGLGTRPDDPGPFVGWMIEPLPSVEGEADMPMYLVVNTPPEGDGRPYIDAADFVGDGVMWTLTPAQ